MRSDEALYEQLVDGDMGAFDQLYARYERPLFGFIRQYVKDTAQAEEVFHEAFLAVVQEYSQGKPIHSFRAWLYSVARNLCLNRVRGHQRLGKAVDALKQIPDAEISTPDHAVLRDEAAAALRQAVDRLPQHLSEVYALRAGGMSYEQLSNVLDLPLGTVKSRVHAMVKHLREELSTCNAK